MELFRNRSAVLDRQVRNAAAGVEDVRLDKGLRGAGVETAGTGATVRGGVRGVVFKLDIDEQCGEEEPASQSLVDEHGVFAKPSQPGQAREIALQERGRINDSAGFRTGRFAAQELRQITELLADHVVI